VEDLVKEILRPMLKEWLDENLPHLVEQLVRAEIERVVRSGR
jgi:cell pole-organizing protein PopZ